MTQAEIKQLIQKQRTFFHSDATLDVEYRIHALQKLKACILKYENEINIASVVDKFPPAAITYGSFPINA